MTEPLTHAAIMAAVGAVAERRSLGAGSSSVGAGSPVTGAGCGDMRRDNGSVDWLIPKSPRLALARALGVDMVPFVFTISVNFSAAGSATITDQGPNKPISRDVLLYAIDIDLQNPAGFTGDEFKPQSDFFFAYTSGIQAAVNIYGAQKRRMPYAPLRAVNHYCSPDEPWVVTEEQIPSMDFTTTTPLPFAGITVTVSFVGKTPATDTTFRMSPVDAFNCLEQMGYQVDYARRLWGCP
jgi:hypothetical protein